MGFFTKGYPRVVETAPGPVIVYVDEGWGQANLSLVGSEVIRALDATGWTDKKALYFLAFA